jgi:BNR repeat-like domain
MMGSPNRLALVCLLGLVAACGGGDKKTKKPTGTPTAAAGKLGDSCKKKGDTTQGSCGEGLVCLSSASGGYCTAWCSGSCANGAVCAESSKTPEMCVKSCKSDSECRTGEGYSCDPVWKSCSTRGMLALKAPVCDTLAPPLPRKTFGKPVPLATGTTPALNPAAYLNKAGDVVVVYQHGLASGSPNSLAAVTVKGGAADTPKEIKLGRDNHYQPTLEVDRAGKLYLAFLGFDGGRLPQQRMSVGVSSSDDGVNWSAAQTASDNANDCPGDTPGCLDRPLVAIGPDRDNAKVDAVYVFYQSETNREIRVTRSTDGGKTFGGGARVGEGQIGDVEVTASGKIHTLFVGGGSNKMGDTENAVWYTNSSDGGQTFSNPIKVSSEGDVVPQWFSNVQILTDLDRKLLYAVYPVGPADGRWDIWLATSKDGGATWSRSQVNDDVACANHMVPVAAIDSSSGKIHIVWYENRSGGGGLAYTNCAPGGTKCTPNELVNEEPFASYGFARHSPKWLGEYNQLMVDPKKKLLHVVWTQTVSENGVPTARVFYANGKLPK